MSKFLQPNFLLQSNLAERLYFEYAQNLPIIDYHNHLPVDQIANDKNFENLTQAWLYGDHYKWRALRTFGVSEDFITGKANDEEKFFKWAEVVPYAIRNPLFHWTQMELQNPFKIDTLLNKNTAKDIYQTTKLLLKQPEFSTNGLLNHFNVEMVGTTDDPTDDLQHHQKIKLSDKLNAKVSPSFRPDKVFNLSDGDEFRSYLKKLESVSDMEITDFASLVSALKKRIDFFDELGCVASDHGFSILPRKNILHLSKVDKILQNVIKGDNNFDENFENDYAFLLLIELSKMYYDVNWVQQFHLGALRNTNESKLFKLGVDTGYDSIGDYRHAESLVSFFNHLEDLGKLPKTIIYNLNPSDNAVFASMIGNFQGEGIKGKIQFGSAWWFLDQLDGMEQQLNSLSNLGLISCFIGMLTDSRSFLSYSRHEYFRRLLCNMFANDVLKGYLPNDEKFLGSIITDICYLNAKSYFKNNNHQ